MIIILFIFGCLIGSFLNVVILRLPKGQSLSGRSHCVFCKETLTWVELVPLASFLIQKGKCRHCKKSFSPRYFIIESLTGLLFALAWLRFEPNSFVSYVSFFNILFALAIFVIVFTIDLEHYLILDTIIFSAIVTVLLAHAVLAILSGTGIGGVLLTQAMVAAGSAIPFFAIWYFSQGKWMGFGDVKLALLLGVIFGWPQVVVAIMAGVLLGGIASVFLLIFGGKHLKSQIPFGTFLSLGAALTLFYGQGILHWYLALLSF
jgi:leader peptidase (prepilin peptidase) / N-methyltransferase